MSPDDVPDEKALLRELGQTMRTARTRAGLLQRELAHRTGYSRSSIANAELGAPYSRDFYERVDVVLGTQLAHGHEVIRALRAERSHAAESAASPDDFQQRCNELIRAMTLRAAGHVAEAQSLKIVLEIHVKKDS